MANKFQLTKLKSYSLPFKKKKFFLYNQYISYRMLKVNITLDSKLYIYEAVLKSSHPAKNNFSANLMFVLLECPRNFPAPHHIKSIYFT